MVGPDDELFSCGHNRIEKASLLKISSSMGFILSLKTAIESDYYS